MTVGTSEPDRPSVRESAHDLVEAHPDEFGAVGDVEVAPVEVEELVDHLTQTPLAEGECSSSPDRLGGDDRMHGRAACADQPLGRGGVGDLGNDGKLVEAAELGVEGEDRLRHRDVAAVSVGQARSTPRASLDPSEREVGANPRITESVHDLACRADR